MTNTTMRIIAAGLVIIAIEAGWLWGRVMWGLW